MLEIMAPVSEHPHRQSHVSPADIAPGKSTETRSGRISTSQHMHELLLSVRNVQETGFYSFDIDRIVLCLSSMSDESLAMLTTQLHRGKNLPDLVEQITLQTKTMSSNEPPKLRKTKFGSSENSSYELDGDEGEISSLWNLSDGSDGFLSCCAQICDFYRRINVLSKQQPEIVLDFKAMLSSIINELKKNQEESKKMTVSLEREKAMLNNNFLMYEEDVEKEIAAKVEAIQKNEQQKYEKILEDLQKGHDEMLQNLRRNSVESDIEGSLDNSATTLNGSVSNIEESRPLIRDPTAWKRMNEKEEKFSSQLPEPTKSIHRSGVVDMSQLENCDRQLEEYMRQLKKSLDAKISQLHDEKNCLSNIVERENDSLRGQIHKIASMNNELRDQNDFLHCQVTELSRKCLSIQRSNSMAMPTSTSLPGNLTNKSEDLLSIGSGVGCSVSAYSELKAASCQRFTEDSGVFESYDGQCNDTSFQSECEHALQWETLSDGNIEFRKFSPHRSCNYETLSEDRPHRRVLSAQPSLNQSSSTQYVDEVYKVIHLGDSSVGKTSLIQVMCGQPFVKETTSTIGIDFNVKTTVSGCHRTVLQLWDTAGQERFRSLSRQYYSKSDGIIVVFDLTNERSLTNTRAWIADAKDYGSSSVPMLLVGSKADACLKNNQSERMSRKARQIAKEYSIAYFEASALTMQNLEEIEQCLVSEMRSLERIRRIPQIVDLDSKQWPVEGKKTFNKRCC